MNDEQKNIILKINEICTKDAEKRNSKKSADIYSKKPQSMSHPNRNNSRSKSIKKRKNTRMKKKTQKHVEKFTLKGWPPEMSVENPSYIGAAIIIAVVLIVGLFMWL